MRQHPIVGLLAILILTASVDRPACADPPDSAELPEKVKAIQDRWQALKTEGASRDVREDIVREQMEELSVNELKLNQIRQAGLTTLARS